MKDIKHEKFKMEMFQQLPKQRPLYAVIATILEHSKEQKDAEGAAEEYYRMKVLEAAMIEQKLITSVSIFVRLRSTSNPQIHVRFLCHRHLSVYFFQNLNLASNSKIYVLFEILKSASKYQIYGYF